MASKKGRPKSEMASYTSLNSPVSFDLELSFLPDVQVYSSLLSRLLQEVGLGPLYDPLSGPSDIYLRSASFHSFVPASIWQNAGLQEIL